MIISIKDEFVGLSSGSVGIADLLLVFGKALDLDFSSVKENGSLTINSTVAVYNRIPAEIESSTPEVMDAVAPVMDYVNQQRMQI